MKKQQKIIELRTAAKLKVSEIENKIAFARCKAAEERSSVMSERANELKGLEAGGTERYDVLAKYRAELADVEWTLADDVAQLKSEIQQVKAECEKKCAAAEDDPEPDKEHPQPQQETVYSDGSEYSARIAARRLIDKLPHIPEGGSISVMISRGEGTIGDRYWFSACTTDGTHSTDGATSKLFDEYSHNANSEAEYVNMVRDSFNARKYGCNE